MVFCKYAISIILTYSDLIYRTASSDTNLNLFDTEIKICMIMDLK
jgi:hypothetical protein